MKKYKAYGQLAQDILQWSAIVVVGLGAAALLGATILAAVGTLQWIDLSVGYDGVAMENAGMYVQIALTALAIALCFFLPTNRRIMKLEGSHRDFTITMQDVSRAYADVHAKDREQVFKMSSEFDAVRERISYLRDHPDLSTLEPSVLEVASQMSHISRELASVYADDKVARARQFLRQRQEETEAFKSRIAQAQVVCGELKQWLHEVEMEENVAHAQLEQLRAEMHEILPELDERSEAPTGFNGTKSVNTNTAPFMGPVFGLPATAAE